MKKLLVASLFALAFPFTSFAADTSVAGCTVPPDHGVYSFDGTVLVSCIKADVWASAQAAGSQGRDGLPTVAPGVTVTDEHGVTDTCPTWYPASGCVDLSHTDAYRAAMHATAQQLVSLGFTSKNAGVFSGWVSSIGR